MVPGTRRLPAVTALLVSTLVAACGGSSPTQPTQQQQLPPVVLNPPSPGTPDPTPTVPPPPPPAVPRIRVTKILAFGDSLTEGRVALTARLLAVVPGSYPERLRAQLSARYRDQTITVLNEGVGGEWAADGAIRFQSVVRAHNPELVLLLQGANDLGALGRAGMTNAIRSLETMAKEARFRGARVVIASLPPQRPPTALIPEYNARVRDVARGEAATFVDLFAAFAGSEATLIGPDGLHPTPAGYERMAQTFFDAIRASFEIPAATAAPARSTASATD